VDRPVLTVHSVEVDAVTFIVCQQPPHASSLLDDRVYAVQKHSIYRRTGAFLWASFSALALLLRPACHGLASSRSGIARGSIGVMPVTPDIRRGRYAVWSCHARGVRNQVPKGSFHQFHAGSCQLTIRESCDDLEVTLVEFKGERRSRSPAD